MNGKVQFDRSTANIGIQDAANGKAQLSFGPYNGLIKLTDMVLN